MKQDIPRTEDPEANPDTVLEVQQPREPLTTDQYAQQFAAYGRAARGTAMKAKSKSDSYGEQLAIARANVYDRAAELVQRTSLKEAADEMLANATRMHVRTAPLLDFDNVGLQYIASRAWQYCAQQIDPTLPETAPQWA